MPDNWEVEQKYVVHQASQLRQNLARLDFELRRVEEHTDVYLRHPCRNFRQSGEALRLRRVDEETMITYKGRRLDGPVKVRPEIELDLLASEYPQWTRLLEHLGFSELPAVCKKRHVFTSATNQGDYTGITVTLDEVETLGQFAEIELLVEDAEQLPQARQRILQLGESLSLEDVQPSSYLSLLLEKLGLE